MHTIQYFTNYYLDSSTILSQTDIKTLAQQNQG